MVVGAELPDGRVCRVQTLSCIYEANHTIELDPQQLHAGQTKSWSNYVIGVLALYPG